MTNKNTLINFLCDIVKTDKIISFNANDFELYKVLENKSNSLQIIEEDKAAADRAFKQVPFNKCQIYTIPLYYSNMSELGYYEMVYISDVNQTYLALKKFQNNVTHSGFIVVNHFMENLKVTQEIFKWLEKNPDYTLLSSGFNVAVLCRNEFVNYYRRELINRHSKELSTIKSFIKDEYSNVLEFDTVGFNYIHTDKDYDLKIPTQIVPYILQVIQPNSIVDIGCGYGAFLKAFKNNGIKEVLGIDCEKCKDNLLEPNEFRIENLENELTFDKRYDTAICLEVAEHIDEQYADNLIKTLTNASNCIIFSAAAPGQRCIGHVNCQWPSYWKKKFENVGYTMIDVLRPKMWNDNSIPWWYRQNMFMVIKADQNEQYDDPIYTDIQDKLHPDSLNS